jgi:hypothetical protein
VGPFISFFFFFFVLPKTKIFSVLRGSLRPAEFWMPKRQRGEATTSRSSSAGSSQIKRKRKRLHIAMARRGGPHDPVQLTAVSIPEKMRQGKKKKKRKRKMSV